MHLQCGYTAGLAGTDGPVLSHTQAQSDVHAPLAWYWALPVLIVGGAIAVGVIQTVYCFLIVPTIPLWLGGIKLIQRNQRFAGILLLISGEGAAIFFASCVGVALATLAELVMWPRTQLAPWSVYFVAGWACLGFFSSSQGKPRTGINTFNSCLLGFSCLWGFLYVAVAHRYLIGPWSWLHHVL